MPQIRVHATFMTGRKKEHVFGMMSSAALYCTSDGRTMCTMCGGAVRTTCGRVECPTLVT